jgi:hypothetical protein
MSAENIFPATERDMKTSNRATFKSLISVVCSCLSQMGDNSLVFAILEKVILEQIVSWLTFMQFCYLHRWSCFWASEVSVGQILFISKIEHEIR